jgi:DNA-binding CsgD family transcriptional regulator
LQLGNKAAFTEWLEKAQFYTEKIKKVNGYKENFYKTSPDLFSLLSTWHTMNGRETLARIYLDSVIIAKDTLNAKLNALHLLRATQFEQNKKEEIMKADKENFRLSERIKNRQIIASIVIIVLLSGLAWLIYRNQKNKRKFEQLKYQLKLLTIEQNLSDTQVKLSSVEKDLFVSEQKLNEAQINLQDFMVKIFEKEKQIELLLNNTESTEELDKIMQSPILTPDEWKKFQTTFEIIYPNFLPTLRQSVPNITAAEIRLIALVKINLTRQQIANTLGISYDTIRVTWHRIRKKASLDNSITPEEFVDEIS